MATVVSNLAINQLQFIIALLSFYFIFNTHGSAPISAFEDTKIPDWYPYNLIETDVSCYKAGICPMFPPGGELSVFPNSEEKFQMALHNMHRLHKTPNTSDIEDVDITKWWGASWSVSTYASYRTAGNIIHCPWFSFIIKFTLVPFCNEIMKCNR